MTSISRTLCIVSIVLLFPAFSDGQDRDSALKLYHQGVELLSRDSMRALNTLQQSMHLAWKSNDHDLYGRVVNDIAAVSLFHQMNLDSAYHWMNLAESRLGTSRRDTIMARLYLNIANFRNDVIYEVDQPIHYYRQSLALWTSATGQLSREVAACYHGMGDVYKYNKFDFHAAEESYEKALGIRERIGFTDTATLFRNYYSLAATNRSQNDYEKALSYGTVAIELAKRVRLASEEDSHGMIANIYRDMADFEKAKFHYQAALKLNDKTKKTDTRAWLYLSFAQSLRDAGDYQEALAYYQKSKKLYDQEKAKETLLYRNMLINMATVYSALGDTRNFFGILGGVIRDIGWDGKTRSREIAEIDVIIAKHFARANQYDSTLSYCQKAIMAAIPSIKSNDPFTNPSRNAIGSEYYLGEVLSLKAVTFRDLYAHKKEQKYLSANLDCLLLAEEMLSAQRNSLDTDEARWSFLDSRFDLYDNIIASLYQFSLEQPSDSLNKQIFRFFERSKARSLADALSQAEHTRRIGSTDSLLREYSTLRADIMSSENAISRMVQTKNAGGIDSVRTVIAALDRKTQVSKAAIEEKYPGYFAARFTGKTPELGDVQRLLSERHQLVLEYFWGAEDVYALAISATGFAFIRAGSALELGEHAGTLRAHLNSDVPVNSEKSFRDFFTSASSLYKQLVQPFERMMTTDIKLQVIPDGVLSQIPFEILLSSDRMPTRVDYRTISYLVKDHSIGYAYSSAMLQARRDRIVRRPSLLAVAFTGGARFRSAQPDMEALENIAGTEQELEALARRFDDGRFLTEQDATESNFKLLSPDFDIIHLAIHGRGDAREDFSASLYFRSRYDSIDDGEFHSYELFGLKLKAVMAVLSACESGLGRDYKGEGMLSMASAFISAGCENTLMSLWKVNDQASIGLTDAFYEQLLDGESIDEALRLSKLDYINSADELTADPRVWAPLVAYGSLRQVFKKDRSGIYLVAVLIASVIALYLLRLRMKANAS